MFVNILCLQPLPALFSILVETYITDTDLMAIAAIEDEEHAEDPEADKGFAGAVWAWSLNLIESSVSTKYTPRKDTLGYLAQTQNGHGAMLDNPCPIIRRKALATLKKLLLRYIFVPTIFKSYCVKGKLLRLFYPNQIPTQ